MALRDQARWLSRLSLCRGPKGPIQIEDDEADATFSRACDRLAASLPVESVVLDGEIVATRNGMPHFTSLMFSRSNAQYAAFDVMWMNGVDLRGSVYEDRKAALFDLIGGLRFIGYVDDYDDPNLFDRAAQLDLEGIVAKIRSDPYDAATATWLKVKHRGYTQNEGRHELFARR